MTSVGFTTSAGPLTVFSSSSIHPKSPKLLKPWNIYDDELTSSSGTSHPIMHPPRIPASFAVDSHSLHQPSRALLRIAVSHPPCPRQHQWLRSTESPPSRICRREFHDYFVTHLPRTSMHPDSTPTRGGPGHKLPRNASIPHSSDGNNSSREDASSHKMRSPSTVHSSHHDTTVVRIPLRSAKHHYGHLSVRGTRPYNEDRYQAGTIEIPAFAKRPPKNLQNPEKNKNGGDTATTADSASGDPQVFYFGIFDGHGGDKCSNYLKDKLHEYVENAVHKFGLESSLDHSGDGRNPKEEESTGNESIQSLEQGIVSSWRETVGGYFRRFKPDYFETSHGGKGELLSASTVTRDNNLTPSTSNDADIPNPSIANVLTYSFLQADLDFVTAQAAQEKLPTDVDAESVSQEDEEDILGLGRHSHHAEEQTPFLGGSTCSCLFISTPTPTPFWHPSSHLSVTTAHLGDTRILLCSTATGAAIPITSTHHPSTPSEATRLRRYAAAFTTDSFGEERVSGLANTRAFGDVRSKRIGVSAEPEIKLLHLAPASHSFVVLVSDGITLALSDQEIVDIVKEAKTPTEAAKSLCDVATELAGAEKGDADNATAMVVRLGGWERRSEGGTGSLGTKEQRDWRRNEASDPRRGRM